MVGFSGYTLHIDNLNSLSYSSSPSQLCFWEQKQAK
jgi:hypothetical protein